MFHQQTKQAQRGHDYDVIIALFAVVTGEQKLRVVFVYWNLGETKSTELKTPELRVSSSWTLNSPTPHLSCVQLEEGKIGLARDAVQTKDAIHHPSPDLNQAVSDRLVRLHQPGAGSGELSPDDVHHVVLVVLLL